MGLVTASTRTTTRAPRSCRKPRMKCSASSGSKDDPLLEVAMELERIALSDEYFIEK